MLDGAAPSTLPAGPRVGLSFAWPDGPSALRAAQSDMFTVGDLAVLRGDGVVVLDSHDGDAAELRHELATCLEHGCLVVVQPGPGLRCASVAVFPDVPVR